MRMKEILFSETKEEILEKINTLWTLKLFPGEDHGFCLVDAFFHHIFQSDATKIVFIAGTTLPSICVVGRKTGRMYWFALKALFPEWQIKSTDEVEKEMEYQAIEGLGKRFYFD